MDNFVTEQINIEEYQDKIDSLEEYVEAIRNQLTKMEEQKTELLNEVLKYQDYKIKAEALTQQLNDKQSEIEQ